MRRSKKYSNVYMTKPPRKIIIKKKRKSKRKNNVIMRVNTKVNKLLNAQSTWYDSDLATTVSTTGHIQPIGLLDITKGTNSGQRLGDKIELKSISFKLQLDVINTSIANGDVFNQIRMLIVQFPQPLTSGIGIEVGDILQTSDIKSHYKKDSKIKYKILHDQLFYMDNQGFGTGASSNPKWQPQKCHLKNFDKKFKFPDGINVVYNAGGVIINNDIQLVLVSDSTIALHPRIYGHIRHVFLP